MSEENRLSPENGEEDETSRTEDCSNRDSESRDQAKHQNSSTEPHCRPEKYPRQLGKEGGKNRSVNYSFNLWKYLSVWVNGQDQPLRGQVDEMIDYINNNPDSLSLATNKHDQNSPTFPSCLSNEVSKLIIDGKDSKEEYNPSNIQDKDLVAPGPSHVTCDVCWKGESNKSESTYSTFEPAVTIGCSKNGPQELSVDPSVDPVPIYQSTIQETVHNSLTLSDDPFADPSHFICPEKPHKCDKCGKGFSKKSYLKRHDKRCGSTDKEYACEECHKEYSSKRNLESHYRKHTGEQPYLCEKCGKGFSDPGTFSRHKKFCGRSADDRPFACDKCNKKFIRKDRLHRHSLIHTGVRPYQCKKCGNGYFTKDGLNKHKKRRGCSSQIKQ